MRHIVANINAQGGLRLPDDQVAAVYKLARSDSVETFERLHKKLHSMNSCMLLVMYVLYDNLFVDAAEYLRQIPLEHWVTFAFPRATFDNVTSNLAESANNWLGEEVRSSDAVTLHFLYMLHLLKNINKRR